jgi:hypothetical protein
MTRKSNIKNRLIDAYRFALPPIATAPYMAAGVEQNDDVTIADT